MHHHILETCDRIGRANPDMLRAAADRQKTLTKPTGSLGRLEDIGNRVAAITGCLTPNLSKKRIFVVAADHGITAEGVSAYPSEVTRQMVLNFLSGGAAINVLARHGDIEVQVVDAGVAYDFGSLPGLIDRKIVHGSANFAIGPAMSIARAERSIAAGIDLATTASQEGVNLIGIGEMGIGNTSSASAIAAVMTGRDVREVTGKGTGIDATTFERKVGAIARGIEINCPDRSSPVDVLAKIGGAEIGVMMGIVLGAAAERLPIVADGFISTAAAVLAVSACSRTADYLFIAHRSHEAGHQALIDLIGIPPLLDLDMRLGEGTGAALAMHLIDASAKILSEMATFQGAGVSDRSQA